MEDAKTAVHSDFIQHSGDYSLLAIGTRSAFFSMKAAELKCQNLIVTKLCKVEHFKLRHFEKRSAQNSVWKDQKQEFRHSLTHGKTVYPSNVPAKSPGSTYNDRNSNMTYNFLHQKYTNKVEIKYKNTINCKVINVCSNKLIV